jgi:hypothetical protein
MRHNRQTERAAIGIRIRHQYGEVEIVGFDGVWRREIYRPFEVHPSEPWNREIHESAMALNHSDTTPHHSKYPTGYNSKCSCCYLNITHTEALHARKVGKE